MNWDQLVGGSNTPLSTHLNVERTVNLYREIGEAQGKAKSQLLGAPGKRVFSRLSDGPLRALFTVPHLPPGTDRLFAIAGVTFFELTSDGAARALGTVLDDGYRAYMDANPYQIGIASAGRFYVFQLVDDGARTAGTFTGPISDTDGGMVTPINISFFDTYFVMPVGGQDFVITDSNNGLVVSALDFAQAEAMPDNIVAQLKADNLLWEFGTESIQPFYDAGISPGNPFLPQLGGTIQKGCYAPGSPDVLNGRKYWIAADSKEGPTVCRAMGSAWEKISTHAVDNALRSYGGLVSLAWCYSYVENGHGFYVINVPQANATWAFDDKTNEWHERPLWNPDKAREVADRGVVHTVAFGKHLVGDRSSGNIYEQSVDILDDSGCVMRRLRRAPFPTGRKRFTINSFEPDIQRGVGLSVASDVAGYDPQVSVRFSRDGGKTFGIERVRSMGKIGEYKKRPRFLRCGQSRDWAMEVVITDPCFVALNGALINED